MHIIVIVGASCSLCVHDRKSGCGPIVAKPLDHCTPRRTKQLNSIRFLSAENGDDFGDVPVDKVE